MNSSPIYEFEYTISGGIDDKKMKKNEKRINSYRGDLVI